MAKKASDYYKSDEALFLPTLLKKCFFDIISSRDAIDDD